MKVYKIGLSYFQTFLNDTFGFNYTLDSILDALSRNEINVYMLIDEFVSYILNHSKDTKLSSSSLRVYLAAIRSYFAYYDIDIVTTKFKRKVKIPKYYREDEQAVDVSDIRRLLLSCSNRGLKAYLLVLSSGGMRAVEALAIRNKDLNFSVNPTIVHIRKEFTKTGVARDIYISEEATAFLKQWLDWKYRNNRKERILPPYPPEELIFAARNYQINRITPHGIYCKVILEFQKLLDVVGMADRKEGLQKRRKITFHTLRRHAKTIISTQVGQDYSEWFLGHAKSPYWTMKERERREIYATKIMKHLTFLDYSGLEMTSKNVETQLTEKEREIAHLRQREIHFSDEIAFMKLNHEKQISSLREEIKSEMKNQISQVISLLKPEIVREALTT